MAFDDCPPAQGVPPRRAEPRAAAQAPRAAGSRLLGERGALAVERTLRWLDRCVAAHARKDEQALFGIVQGGTDLDLRRRCVQAVAQHDLLGYAIGGVAVGEGFAGLQAVVEYTAPLLPADRPRYLMGVGYERDILVAVRAGVDMFDCVLPTRNGRNACAFTRTGALRLRNARYAQDPQVIEPGCDCPACAGTWSPAGNTGTATSGFSRSYLRHLFQAGEMLGPILVSAHNLRHFQRYMLDIRRAITDNDWSLIERAWPVAGAEQPD
jgi:queuine tRNA-ribosyltransferase